MRLSAHTGNAGGSCDLGGRVGAVSDTLSRDASGVRHRRGTFPRAAGAFFAGFEAGVRAFRLTGKHEIPSDHPHGATPEGVEWFRGCVAGLEQCKASFER